MNELERKIEQLEKYIEVKEQECNELQDKIDRAIEYLKDNACYTDNNDFVDDLRYDCCKDLLNILKGE